MTMDSSRVRVLSKVDTSAGHNFIQPSKRINEGQDVNEFLVSRGYVDIMTFLIQLNRSLFPTKLTNGQVQPWPLNCEAVEYSAPVRQLQQLLTKLEAILEEAPPDTGPRRFGNVSFRKWFQLVESRASSLLEECLSTDILQTPSSDGGSTAETELLAYFLGSWGSPQRLDYGTGHELSFLAFLAGIWKLHGFPQNSPGVEERAIVLGVIQPYLELVRTIIKRYTLEPAGSHGVWGLDDHSFIPYIFGSAQLAPALSESDPVIEEGSLPEAPSPSEVTRTNAVQRERETNLYFSAIGFIYDVKRGPFWEHSPMLFDISGIQAGWAKINKGMIKMYNAEVLSKFPVVQHFPFGSLFSWDRDPNAITPAMTAHTNTTAASRRTDEPAPPALPAGSGTRAPWAGANAPGSTPNVPRGINSIRPDTSRLPPGPMGSTRAPLANAQPGEPAPSGNSTSVGHVSTRAPWAQ
ncbi:Phosphotyrosyl phosphate activator protein-domain-containing protein [Aspergillus californicus]